MKYRIGMTRTVVEGATVIVEADDVEAAEAEAIRRAYNTAQVEWSFVGLKDPIEIIECEPTN